jgi:Tfp pilus assembly protein PilX
MKEGMRHPRSDSGFALIEVIVSAVVLALVALAVLAGVEGASSSSGREKARAVAMSLAEADQERLRQLPVTELAKYADKAPYLVPDAAGSTRTADGVTYTVASKAQWVRDDTGDSVSCTSDGHAADYFHITSTVTSNVVGTRIAPAKIDSIAAPNVAYGSTHGTLTVKITDPSDTGVQGVMVNVSGGSAPAPKATNSAGCAVFEQVSAATAGTDYTVSLNTPGYVDHFGVQSVTRTTKVSPGKLTTVTIPYAPAPNPATVASVYTYAPGSTTGSPGALVTSKSFQVSAVNSGDASVMRNWPSTAPASEAASQSAAALFPFSGAYTYYTGNCHYNDPTDQNYYKNLNTVAPNIGLLTGQQKLANASTVSVTQPPLNVWIDTNKSGANATASMIVWAIPQAPSGDSCVQPRIPLQTVDVDASATYKWMVARTATPFDAGVPYGNYKLCFKDGSGSGARYWTSPVYDNTKPPTGNPTMTKYSPISGWSATAC